MSMGDYLLAGLGLVVSLSFTLASLLAASVNAFTVPDAYGNRIADAGLVSLLAALACDAYLAGVLLHADWGWLGVTGAS